MKSSKYKLILSLLLLCSRTVQADSPIIAVASNLTSPMNEIAEQFSNETGGAIRLSFGSSGNLSRQIVQGAPYEIFISASKTYVDFLIEQNVEIKHQYEFIDGEIGFFVPGGSAFINYPSPQAITNALKFGKYGRIAIANPDHAPYGIAAIEALQTGGVWALSRSNLILAESVAQIVPYLHTGDVDLAIIPKSFVLQNALGQSGKYLTIASTWYNSISQYVVILANTNPVTFNFSEFLTGDKAKVILEKYGYRLTGNR